MWCDIQVRVIKKDEPQRITWANPIQELDPLKWRSPATGFPKIPGFHDLVFSWSSHWGIKTPKGYSALFTHPLNRTDLPFITTSGIMDTDKWGIWGNQPFYLQKNWEGVIEAGTPIIQVIPFKRDEWKSVIDESLMDWANYEDIRRTSKFRGYYKNNYWTKKKYD